MKEPKLFSAQRRSQRQGLYQTPVWRRIRSIQLRKQPLCVMCEEQRKLTPATVCDHIDPLWPATLEGLTRGPFQSLCRECHKEKSFEDMGKMIRAEKLKIQVSSEYDNIETGGINE